MSSWFGFRKKSDPPTSSAPPAAGAPGDQAAEPSPAGAFQPDPEKARRWFNHARTVQAASDYAYALFCYASGIKLDPGDMSAHQDMWEAAVQYFNSGGKPATGKELRKIEGPGPIDRFAAAEYAWMKDLNNYTLAIRLLQAAAKAHQTEFGRWVAPRIKNIVFKQKKASKSVFVQAKDAFAALGAWDEAFQCGEAAVRLDPSDSALMAELKDLTAQRAIHQGGYAQAAGQEGGFRAFIRDADKQRALEEAEALAAGADTEARNLQRAREAYEANPLNPDAINKYGQLLKRTEEGEETAYEVYMKAFRDVGEYRFRMAAGDIRIAQARRQLKAARDAMSASPDDQAAKAEHERRREELLALETAELTERAEKYPTDKSIRFELGRIQFERGNYQEAMPAFQAAKEDARFRVQAAHMLGRSFAAENWHQEAIGEFREALEHLEAADKDRELEIRYDLMLSMLSAAREESSLAMAKEAADLCSTILRKDITFRDIRNKRREVDQLIRELGGAA